ncbi:tyrosine-type recombinase/integrase [Chengkuizengella axinellae]|uniref:Tyrosine-type recombinase/integrase n=1 Tax=Chengkuizengella axinellae TaxID=3064388 RepID=A0ABT9J4N0_9BACL|nr:tyrosine-type recombinase/integrase [Chengkuizengella sp. 2205SS18-9]MDP5276561.1 tyrosine-type recombinase/integrase [Chengkuizengella sp. 2205SS18-9]
MASFQKRGKTWQYTISRMINGVSKPIRKSGFSTKKEAQIAATEVEADLQKGITPHLKPEPFDEYFAEWLKLYKKDVSKNTMSRYLNTLKTIQEHFKGVPIQNINKRTYQLFLNEYGLTRAKTTTKKINGHIRACIKDAIDEGIIHTDFTRRVVFSGSVQTKKADEKHLSYFDSKRLLNELQNNLDSLTHYLILLALTSGLRFSELLGLTRKDFDFEKNEISINKTWGHTKKMHVGFGKTKNEQSNRTIKMDAKTMDVFKKMFNNTPENLHGLIFYCPVSKYKIISNGAANKLLKTLLEKLNINPISIHGLRHTHASVLLYKKVSIYYISERLGHSAIETTLQHYAHIVKELREKDEKNTVKIFGDMVI